MMSDLFRRSAALVLAAVVMLLLPTAGRAADPYEIYVIGEQTGSNAFVGNEEIKTALAVEALINKTGGLHGRPVKMVVKDSQTNPQIAVQFMNEAVAKGVPVVLGGGVASTCLAMAGVIKDDGPVLYCWSSGVLPAPGSWVYSSGFSALDQVGTGVRYLRERGWTKIAALTSTDATGQDADRNLDLVFANPENRSLTLVTREHFNVTDISLAAQLSHVKQSGAVALIAWTTGTPFGTVLRGMRDAGIDLPVLTTGGNLSYSQMEAYKDSIPSNVLFGGVPMLVPEAITNPAQKRAVAQVVDIFKGQEGRLDIGYAVSWDGPMLVMQALRKIGLTATAAQIRDSINAQTAYLGLNGVMNFKVAPQRGLTKENIIVVRWDPQRDRFVAMSAPGGMPVR